MDTPVTQEVLRDLDALIVVSSPWVDGAAAAGQTMDWLANRGLTGLLQRTVVVLNDSDGHADKRTRAILAQQFAGQGQAVVEVPFDGHLRPGGVIERTTEMSPATRRAFIEIAAALAEQFPQRRRPQPRHAQRQSIWSTSDSINSVAAAGTGWPAFGARRSPRRAPPRPGRSRRW